MDEADARKHEESSRDKQTNNTVFLYELGHMFATYY